MSQIEFWNAVAGTKEFSHPLDRDRFAALSAPGARILDYGCGYGRICRQLHAAGYADVAGVDPSPRMVARARTENPQLSFQVLDERMPFADASFDAVLVFSVLTCICDDAGQRDVVGDIARVLRPGGIIYVSDILLQDDGRNRARYDRGVRHPPSHNASADHRSLGGGGKAIWPYGVFELEPGVMFRHLTRAWIDELFGGFDRIELVELPVTTMNGNAARGFQYFGRKAWLT
jgi:SAM-dependent methyltransferase